MSDNIRSGRNTILEEETQATARALRTLSATSGWHEKLTVIVAAHIRSTNQSHPS